MYTELLLFHSWFRWLAVLSLLYAIFLGYRGWLTQKPFLKFHNSVRFITILILHLQLTLGILLYYISPITSYFIKNFNNAVSQQEIRFFSLDHSTAMLFAIVIVSIGASKVKRKTTDREKFKTMAIWFSIGFLFILASIPWEFSPYVSRPLFRY
ncbi:hypothetical protein [Xanthovirga aplysinae]|uniref:hypothetical protein n=1 Tax=Xanthovirga aplysinae TaxID=2529853 RepID=UPI0012BBF294|nr:hypothetical protein [Xanthovirga aplysinae]MTI32627.1 hypothetical protein [Xanthovirga aplysinae]